MGGVGGVGGDGGGQGFGLHVRVRVSAGHLGPCVMIVRLDVSTPPPHDTGHADHADQLDTVHRAGGGVGPENQRE